MKFKNKLIKGTFLKRYKRFFADIQIETNIVTAHTANTGTMKSCLGEHWPVLLSFHDSPTRKLKYNFEMIHNQKSWIGINTSLTNSLAIEAIQNGVIKELQGYQHIKPEFKIGSSRIDFLLSNSENDLCFVEVKNVTLVNEKNQCLFPDSVTERGQKHLNELIEIKKSGHRAVLLFIVQREDCDSFLMENEIDPKYSSLLVMALAKGVELLVYQCKLTPKEIVVDKKLIIK